jgi:dolichol-phosphate mannosyltransferase
MSRVDVVIPSWNGRELLDGVLASLEAEAYRDKRVIVVDNGSEDGTVEHLRAAWPHVDVVALPENRGFAAAVNAGVARGDGEYVALLNNDMELDAGWLGALVAALDDADWVTAGPRFACDTPGERLLHPSLLASLVYRFGPQDVARPARIVANGQCMVARREALLRAGGWARVGSYMTEDVALARALVSDGWRFRLADGADVLEVRMYESARETWHGWGRSIIDPQVNTRAGLVADLAILWLTMALPLPRLLVGRGDALDVLLVAQRLALTAAFTRAYRPRGPAFWLSPLADVPVALRLTWSVLRPPRTWRGRTY